MNNTSPSNPSKYNSEKKSALHSLATVNYPSYLKVKVAAAAVKAVASEYCKNQTYYNDVAKFNFANGVANDKRYDTLEYWCLPREIRDRLQRLYSRFRNMYVSSIYRNLGMRQTNTNESMPLESKYVYTYYKKYNTLSYYPGNRVYDDEVLRVLSYDEEEEISRFF